MSGWWVPVDKELLTSTVPVNKELLTGTVSVNNFYLILFICSVRFQFQVKKKMWKVCRVANQSKILKGGQFKYKYFMCVTVKVTKLPAIKRLNFVSFELF